MNVIWLTLSTLQLSLPINLECSHTQFEYFVYNIKLLSIPSNEYYKVCLYCSIASIVVFFVWCVCVLRSANSIASNQFPESRSFWILRFPMMLFVSILLLYVMIFFSVLLNSIKYCGTLSLTLRCFFMWHSLTLHC